MSWIWGFDVWRLSFSCESFANQWLYFGGSIIQDNGYSVAREHLLLLARVYILQSTYVQGLANRRTFPSIRRIGSVTIGTEIPRENVFTSNLSMPDHEGVLEISSFESISICFYWSAQFWSFKSAFCSLNKSILSSHFSDNSTDCTRILRKRSKRAEKILFIRLLGQSQSQVQGSGGAQSL